MFVYGVKVSKAAQPCWYDIYLTKTDFIKYMEEQLTTPKNICDRCITLKTKKIGDTQILPAQDNFPLIFPKH